MEQVSTTEIPKESIYKNYIDSVDYYDAFQMELTDKEASLEEVYVGIFSYSPKWMKYLMLIRNGIVKLFGLRTDIASDGEQNKKLFVGEKSGMFHIYYLSSEEIIAGEDDKHLNFRVSVFKEENIVVISTIVQYHNTFGKVYMSLISPFHKIIVRTMMRRYLKSRKITI